MPWTAYSVCVHCAVSGHRFEIFNFTYQFWCILHGLDIFVFVGSTLSSGGVALSLTIFTSFTVGDIFSCHAVDNPDVDSEMVRVLYVPRYMLFVMWLP